MPTPIAALPSPCVRLAHCLPLPLYHKHTLTHTRVRKYGHSLSKWEAAAPPAVLQQVPGCQTAPAPPAAPSPSGTKPPSQPCSPTPCLYQTRGRRRLPHDLLPPMQDISSRWSPSLQRRNSHRGRPRPLKWVDHAPDLPPPSVAVAAAAAQGTCSPCGGESPSPDRQHSLTRVYDRSLQPRWVAGWFGLPRWGLSSRAASAPTWTSSPLRPRHRGAAKSP